MFASYFSSFLNVAVSLLAAILISFLHVFLIIIILERCPVLGYVIVVPNFLKLLITFMLFHDTSNVLGILLDI